MPLRSTDLLDSNMSPSIMNLATGTVDLLGHVECVRGCTFLRLGENPDQSREIYRTSRGNFDGRVKASFPTG